MSAEYLVTLHTANGDVTTAYRDLHAALTLVHAYVVDGKHVSIRSEAA